MNLLQQVQLAAQLFLKRAYPDGPSASVSEIFNELQGLESSQQLRAWPRFERLGNRYFLRLGNQAYQHMKLVFLLENDRPLFYVDAHDSHFALPPGMPGYEKLLVLREGNQRLKQMIEAAWAAENLPIFGRVAPPDGVQQVCKHLKVLVIDDELQILDMLTIVVISLGAKLWRAESAAQGRALIRQRGLPDLIFCDIMMPHESGYDFLEWFKEQKNAEAVPFYFITGLTLDRVAVDEQVKLIYKPFSAKKIMKIMKQVKPALGNLNESAGT